MEIETPSWLNESFLETVLQKEEDQKPKVSDVNFTVKPAVSCGNNFTSHLYRVTIEYITGQSIQKESTSLIVKMPIEKGVMNEFSEKMDFFAKEPRLYNELLPKLSKRCMCALGPKTFFCPIKNVIIMQDMKQDGYVLCDRFKQLDFQHCKLVMEKLGKLHASSVAEYHNNPELIKSLGKEPMFTDDGDMSESTRLWVESSIRLLILTLNEENQPKEHINLITNKINTVWESVVKMLTEKPNTLNVLNHGDCWISNILFKYNDSGIVSDAVLLDFQQVKYSPPASDILYFIWTSANEDTRENHLKDLFDIYLKTLNGTMEALGCKERLTNKEFLEEIKSESDYVLLTIACQLPFMFCDTEDVPDLAGFSPDDFKNCEHNKSYLKMFNGKRFREILPALFQQYVSMFLL